MNKILERPFAAVSILLVLCAYLFFFKLGGMALTDPDETFYAQTAKEMLNKGDWVTPYLYGKPQFEKPIMIYWLIEASYKILGVHEAAARLPSAIFALFGVIAIYLLGKLLFNKITGFISAVIFAANVEYVILSRACVTDMVLTTFMLLGILFFFYGYLKEKGYFYILSSAAFAFAVLTKGPVAIILPAAAFIAFLFFTKDMGRLKRLPVGWSILVFLAIAAPWYIAAYRLHGKEFIDAFFGFQNVTRFLQSEHKIGSQIYYNIPVIFAGFFPWSVFLPLGLWHMFKKARPAHPLTRSPEHKSSVFTLTWFFVIFLFFTASSTKLPTYVFPSFISMALIVGALLSEFLNREKVTKQVDAGVKISYYLLFTSVIAGAIGVCIYLKNHSHMPGILPGVIVSGIFLVSGFIMTTAAFIKERYAIAFFLIVASLAVFLLPLNLLVLPQIERYETSKEAAQKLKLMMKEDEPVGAQSNYLPGLAFYADKFALDLDRHEEMVKFLNSEKRVWCVIKEQNHRGLYDPAINSEYVKPSYLLYKVGKRVIVTNRMPENGGYILKREFGK
ncbi:MAG: glycosyltransferase family 39 protein [Candidatus Omnitrophota bacterium]|nr:glycosyltransferase family 39 protein [Candidatus Omnitrophota bacterium]